VGEGLPASRSLEYTGGLDELFIVRMVVGKREGKREKSLRGLLGRLEENFGARSRVPDPDRRRVGS